MYYVWSRMGTNFRTGDTGSDWVGVYDWIEQQAWCNPWEKCRSYFTETDYWVGCWAYAGVPSNLAPACIGRYKSQMVYDAIYNASGEVIGSGNRCTPNLSPGRKLSFFF